MGIYEIASKKVNKSPLLSLKRKNHRKDHHPKVDPGTGPGRVEAIAKSAWPGRVNFFWLNSQMDALKWKTSQNID